MSRGRDVVRANRRQRQWRGSTCRDALRTDDPVIGVDLVRSRKSDDESKRNGGAAQAPSACPEKLTTMTNRAVKGAVKRSTCRETRRMSHVRRSIGITSGRMHL